MNANIPDIERLRRDLALLDKKRFELASQIQQLQTQCNKDAAPSGENAVDLHSSEAAKIRLFRELFCGREDVFPLRFESRKSGRSGYQPACVNEWRPGICNKPKIKCARCEHREFVPVSDAVVRQHLDFLYKLLSPKIDRLVLLKGGLGRKRLKEIKAKLDEWRDMPHVVLATGRYLGEGFDDPRLDTLFLAMPVSWQGILSQYAGRLHRLHNDKSEVQIYDYVDQGSPVLVRMFERRLKGYEAFGYKLSSSEELLL